MRIRVLALALSITSTAHAAECIRVDPTALAPNPLRDHVVVQLRAAFARRNLTVCSKEEEPPIATVTLVSSESSDVRIVLSVRDAITDKTVERTVKLDDLPSDARALALAQMTDELLRASWAELAVEDAPAPRMAVPAQVKDALPATPKRSIRVEIDGLLAMDHFAHGFDQLGADAVLRVFPVPRFGFVIRGGPRVSLVQATTAGALSGTGVFAAIGPSVSIVSRGPFSLGIDGNVGMLYVRLEGRSLRETTRAADGVGALVLGTLTSSFQLSSRFRALLEVGGGGAVRGVRASDGVQDLGGPAGAVFTLRAGVGGDL